MLEDAEVQRVLLLEPFAYVYSEIRATEFNSAYSKARACSTAVLTCLSREANAFEIDGVYFQVNAPRAALLGCIFSYRGLSSLQTKVRRTLLASSSIRVAFECFFFF